MRKPSGITRKTWNSFCNWYKFELRINPRNLDRINRGTLEAFKDGWNLGFLEGTKQKRRAPD